MTNAALTESFDVIRDICPTWEHLMLVDVLEKRLVVAEALVIFYEQRLAVGSADGSPADAEFPENGPAGSPEPELAAANNPCEHPGWDGFSLHYCPVCGGTVQRHNITNNIYPIGHSVKV